MFKVNVKFILIILASYIFAIMQGGNLPYRVFYGLILAFVMSFSYIISKRKSINIQVKFNNKIYRAGDENEFTTIVKNYGILPAPYVIVKNKTLERIKPKYNGNALWLNPDESKFIKNTVKFNQRGVYNFGEIYLSLSDLFCIFQRNKNIDLNIPIKVYPKLYNVDKFLSKGRDIFKNSIAKSTNMEDLYSVREIRKYNVGDNLKRVNWKVSAKHGELYVKDLDIVSGEESNIFLDMSKYNILMDDQGIKEEQLIDLCASIVNYMELRGIKTKLFINASGKRNFHIETREDFNVLMDFFVTQKSDGEDSFARFIDSNIDKIPKLSWIGIITSGIDDELKDSLIIMKDKGYSITVFYCAGSLKDLSNMEILKKVGIDVLGFNEIINLEETR